MSSSNHSNLLVPANAIIPAVLALAVSGFSYLALTGTLESRRPRIVDDSQQPPSPVGAEGYSTSFARLWQDPFSDLKASETDGTGPASTTAVAAQIRLRVDNLQKSNPSNRVLCMPVLVPGGPYVESREQRRRTRYALLSALGDAGYSLIYPERMSYIELPVRVQTGPPGSERLIPRMVVPIKIHYRSSVESAPPDTVDNAKRLPPQYAAVVVLWINESQLGTYPLRAVSQIVEQVFGCVKPAKKVEPCDQAEPDEQPEGDKKPEVKQPIDVAIIGPSSSDGLLAMARDVDTWKNERKKKDDASTAAGDVPPAQQGWQHLLQRAKLPIPPIWLAPLTELAEQARYDSLLSSLRQRQGFSGGQFETVRLFSPRATVHRDALNDHGWNNKLILQGFMTGSRQRSGLQVVRTTGDDKSLVELLRQELKLRDAWPQLPSPWLPLSADPHVVLITERDTLYGQAFRHTFETAINEDLAALDPVPQRLHHFTYLRGADGQYPLSDKREEQPQTTATTPPNGYGNGYGNQAGRQQGAELAHGSGQFDYIRRLAQDIKDLRQQLLANNGDIKAIGLVGTDLFDKLLILRALRPEFPTVRFFTTELDARLAHRDELPYTRNLLVASHFALELDQRTFDRTVLPFRDSHQTATYFSVRLAVDHQDRAWRKLLSDPADPWGLRSSALQENPLKPLMFEIGRNGPYQLTAQRDASATLAAGKHHLAIHPSSPRESSPWASWWWLWRLLVVSATVVLATLGGLWFKQTEREGEQTRRYREITLVVAAVLLGALIVAASYQFHYRQLGASMGAVMVGAVLLIPVVGMVFLLVVTMLHFVDHKSDSRDEPSRPPADKPRMTLLGTAMLVSLALGVSVLILLTWDHQRADGQPLEFDSAISIWPPTLLRLAALVLGVWATGKAMRKLAYNQRKIEQEYGIPSADREPLTLRETLKKAFGQWRQGRLWSRPHTTEADPTALCQSYFEYERSDARLIRISIWAVVLFCFLLAVFQSTEYPALAYRGSVSQTTATLVLYLASLVTIFVFLLTLDALLVCQRLVDHLGGSHQNWHALSGCSRYDYEADRRGWLRTAAAPVVTVFVGERELRPNADGLNELVTVRLVGKRTRVVSNLLYLPFVLISVMLLARHPLLDSSYLPPALVVIIAAFAIALLSAAAYLRRTAARARLRGLARLQQQTSRSLLSSERGTKEKQLELIRQDMLAEGRGAFKPLSDDPLLGALAVPTVTATALLFLERYLT